jgi:hypothetical protein
MWIQKFKDNQYCIFSCISFTQLYIYLISIYNAIYVVIFKILFEEKILFYYDK